MTKRQPLSIGGRPSKGDRHIFVSRVPRNDANGLMALAELYDVSYSEMVAECVRMAVHHDPEIRLPLPAHSDQQELSA